MSKLKIYKTANLSKKSYSSLELVLVAEDKYEAVDAFNNYLENWKYKPYWDWKIEKVTINNIKEYDIGKILCFDYED